MSACSEQWPPGSWQTLCTVCARRLLCTTGTHHVLCHSFALLVTCSSGLPARSKPPAPYNGSVCYSLYEDEVAARERLAECELRWRAAGLPPQLGLALVNSARASEKKSQREAGADSLLACCLAQGGGAWPSSAPARTSNSFSQEKVASLILDLVQNGKAHAPLRPAPVRQRAAGCSK